MSLGSWIFIIWREKLTTTNKIPAEIFRKYDDLRKWKEVMMVIQQSHKKHLTQIDFEEVEEVLFTNWQHQINDKRSNNYIENLLSKKNIKEKRFNVKVKIEGILHNVCYTKIAESRGSDEIYSIEEIYTVTNDCTAKNC